MSSVLEQRGEKDLPVNLIRISSVSVTVNTKLVKATRRLIHNRFCHFHYNSFRRVQLEPQMLLVAHLTQESDRHLVHDQSNMTRYISLPN